MFLIFFLIINLLFCTNTAWVPIFFCICIVTLLSRLIAPFALNCLAPTSGRIGRFIISDPSWSNGILLWFFLCRFSSLFVPQRRFTDFATEFELLNLALCNWRYKRDSEKLDPRDPYAYSTMVGLAPFGPCVPCLQNC